MFLPPFEIYISALLMLVSTGIGGELFEHMTAFFILLYSIWIWTRWRDMIRISINTDDYKITRCTYEHNKPKVGDQAPDFELRDIQGENPIRLSDFQGQMPVVLIFGSFT